MALSLELIAETMKPYGAEILLAREQSFHFRQVKILALEDLPNLAEDVLYISQPKALRKLSRSVFRNHCFVFSARPSALERYRDLVNAILCFPPGRPPWSATGIWSTPLCSTRPRPWAR